MYFHDKVNPVKMKTVQQQKCGEQSWNKTRTTSEELPIELKAAQLDMTFPCQPYQDKYHKVWNLFVREVTKDKINITSYPATYTRTLVCVLMNEIWSWTFKSTDTVLFLIISYIPVMFWVTLLQNEKKLNKYWVAFCSIFLYKKFHWIPLSKQLF